MAPQHAGAVVVDHHVGFAREREHLGAAGFRGDVDLAHPLAGIEGSEGARAGGRAPHHVAAAGLLHLRDLGTHLRKVKRRERTGDHMAEVEHADAAQRLRGKVRYGGHHFCTLSCAALTILSSFSVSACMNFVNSAGELLSATGGAGRLAVGAQGRILIGLDHRLEQDVQHLRRQAGRRPKAEPGVECEVLAS